VEHMDDPIVVLYVHVIQLDGHSEHNHNQTPELGLQTSNILTLFL